VLILEQKKGTSLHTPSCRQASSFKTVERLSVPVIYFRYRAGSTQTSPAIECKEGLCISRLVKFELLFELKIEQKRGISLDTPCYKPTSSLKQSVRYVCGNINNKHNIPVCISY
jgi:hypothetical protein